jgi:hypothetical protein
LAAGFLNIRQALPPVPGAGFEAQVERLTSRSADVPGGHDDQLAPAPQRRTPRGHHGTEDHGMHPVGATPKGTASGLMAGQVTI